MVVLYQCPASVSHSFKRGSNPKIVQYQYIRGTTGITTHTLLHPSAVPRPGVNDVSFVSGGDLGKPSLLRSYQFIHATQERATRDSDVVLEVELDKCLGLGLITRSRAKEDHCFVWVHSEVVADWPEAAGSARTPIPLCPRTPTSLGPTYSKCPLVLNARAIRRGERSQSPLERATDPIMIPMSTFIAEHRRYVT